MVSWRTAAGLWLVVFVAITLANLGDPAERDHPSLGSSRRAGRCAPEAATDPTPFRPYAPNKRVTPNASGAR